MMMLPILGGLVNLLRVRNIKKKKKKGVFEHPAFLKPEQATALCSGSALGRNGRLAPKGQLEGSLPFPKWHRLRMSKKWGPETPFRSPASLLMRDI